MVIYKNYEFYKVGRRRKKKRVELSLEDWVKFG